MNYKTGIESYRYKPTRRHLMVVTTFIIAASLLVVLTTFAINMLTATGDMNRLLVRWSQNNGDSMEYALQYLDSGDEDDLIKYQTLAENRMYAGDVIDELLSDTPETDFIFQEFSQDEIHPNEITGLIRIFSLFREAPEVQKVKQTWNIVSVLSAEKNALIDSLISLKKSGLVVDSTTKNQLIPKNREINNYIRGMVFDISDILILLKRYSLWFTVLLGLLIVLIGVIYTVRGIKNIKQMQHLLSERDYLALFPELNQYPVLNLNMQGEVGFINQSAQSLFPKLKEAGLSHPFLKELKSRFNEITSDQEKTMLFEVEIEGKYYQQAAHYLSKQKGIHLHSIEISELKKKQFELSHMLREKESLLAEVHHRVKNNMAVITGLLELQEMMGEDPNTALSESRSRIKSMAIIHELLYQSDTLSEIDTRQYLEKLGKHLQLSLSNIESVTVLESETEQALNINLAVPLGLLLNELAFYLCKENSTANSSIELELQMITVNNTLCLRIKSPQQGIPNPLKHGNKPTLRMNLIKNLLAQIEGDLIFSPSDTLLIDIKFEISLKKGSSSTLI